MSRKTQQISFKYSPYWRKVAPWRDDCDCPEDDPCIEGIFFDDPDVDEGVCLSELLSGRVKVSIPNYLRQHLIQSLQASGKKTSEEYLDAAIDELSRTPPVPWIQHNEWPVCCGDFCQYLGELRKLPEEIEPIVEATTLWEVTEETSRQKFTDAQSLWKCINSDWCSGFLFECAVCKKRVVVIQSY